MTADPLDTAIRCLGRAITADEAACTRFMIPHYRDEATAALAEAGLHLHAERCEEGCLTSLHETLLRLWRAK